MLDNLLTFKKPLKSEVEVERLLDKIMFSITGAILLICNLVIFVIIVLAIIFVIRLFKSITNRLAAIERRLEIDNKKND